MQRLRKIARNHPLCCPLLGLLMIAQVASAKPDVTLKEVIEEAVQMDLDVQKLMLRQERSNARIDEIARRGGWEGFLAAEQRFRRGDRLEARDDSQDRSVRSIRGDLDDDEWSVEIGLKNRFFGPAQQRRAEIAQEKLDQLDRLVTIFRERRKVAFDAAEAYLDVVQSTLLTSMISEQIRYASEVIRIFQVRVGKGEALPLEVLEAEYDQARLQEKALRTAQRTERQLDYLRLLLQRPELTPEELAQPEVPGASEIVGSSLEQLTERALRLRPDLQAAQLSLEAATDFARKYAKVLPDVDFELGLSFRDRERDFADELREDDFAQFHFGGEITIPLSIQSRNRARRRRFQLRAETRRINVQARYRSVRRAARRAWENWRLALADCEIQTTRLAHAQESARVVELQADRLPDLLGQSPEIANYRAKARVLEVRTDQQRAERDRVIALLRLAAQTHYLLQDSVEKLLPGDPLEKPVMETNH